MYYATISQSTDPRVARIHNLADKVKKYYYLREGRRMEDLLPPTTVLNLHERGGDMLTDVIDNASRVLYVSERTRALLAQSVPGADDIEYLPFVLHDKRGRIVQEQYFIANPLKSIACFDFDKAKYTLNSAVPPGIRSIKRLLVHEDRIPGDAKLFRLAEDPKLLIIRSDLIELFTQEGLTGLNVLPLGQELT